MAVASLVIVAAPAGATEPDERERMPPVGATRLVSQAAVDRAANGNSYGGATSENGRYTVFRSQSSNIVPGSACVLAVSTCGYLRDNKTGEIRVLATRPEEPTFRAYVSGLDISADGRWITYHSSSATLVEDDTNGRDDVFVEDRRTGEITLISRTPTGASANGGSDYPSISADGRYVAFQSTSTDLVVGADPTGAALDVFVHDRVSGTTEVVSIRSDGSRAVTGMSHIPRIDGSGQRVVFCSSSSDLVAGDVNGVEDAFMHDLTTGTTTMLSVTTDGEQGDGISFTPVLSLDGSTVVFASEAENLVPTDDNGRADVYHLDLASGDLTLVSRTADGSSGASSSNQPDVSGDGRVVTFSSASSDLVGGEQAAGGKVFALDLDTGVMIGVSRGVDGTLLTGGRPNISADGRWITFESTERDLVRRHARHKEDVFLHRLG